MMHDAVCMHKYDMVVNSKLLGRGVQKRKERKKETRYVTRRRSVFRRWSMWINQCVFPESNNLISSISMEHRQVTGSMIRSAG